MVVSTRDSRRNKGRDRKTRMSEQEGAGTFGKNDRSTVDFASEAGERAPRVPDVAPWQSRVSPELSFWSGPIGVC